MAAIRRDSESEFVHFVIEHLQPIGPVTSRRMFGGYGIFLHDQMFALVAWDTLYLKADDDNRAAFEVRGLEPFVYTAKGRPIQLSYYEAPAEGLDDSEVLCAWARSSIAAAVRAQAHKRPSAAAAG
jgi:DNA transformation protein